MKVQLVDLPAGDPADAPAAEDAVVHLAEGCCLPRGGQLPDCEQGAQRSARRGRRRPRPNAFAPPPRNSATSRTGWPEGLVRSGTITIGILADDLADGALSHFVAGAQAALAARGHAAVLVAIRPEIDAGESLHKVLEHRVDGLLVIAPTLEQNSSFSGALRDGLPLVSLSHLPGHLGRAARLRPPGHGQNRRRAPDRPRSPSDCDGHRPAAAARRPAAARRLPGRVGRGRDRAAERAGREGRLVRRRRLPRDRAHHRPGPDGDGDLRAQRRDGGGCPAPAGRPEHQRSGTLLGHRL